MAKNAVQTFGKYQILERIATGGMAEIYKARLESIGGFQRTFAIKRILPHLSQNADYVAMLVDEAKVAGLLTHANIVQILDLGQIDGIWYIAMEYVDGRDLGDVLKHAASKGIVLPVPHAVYITLELLKGLEYAHQRQVMRGGRPVPLNIIHRDISPPNILLSFQGEVKLTDFGIARASHKALETHSGIIKGRFDYMSPEQAAAAKDLDQRSDLFSVGVVLYEMLTGEHPFRSESEFGTLDKIRSGRYVPVSAKNPEIPFVLETIVDRALRPDRNERYANATAFKEALDKFFHDSGFIFTHSTLSGYARSLYPELRGGASNSIPPVLDFPTDFQEGDESPTTVTNPKLDDDGPTNHTARSIPKPTPLSVSDFPAYTKSAQYGDEQPTVVRRIPHVAKDDTSPTNGTTSDTSPRPVTTPPEAEQYPPPIPVTGRTGVVPLEREAEPRWLWPLVGAATFMIGLFLGLGVGFAIATLGDMSSNASVLVNAPVGATVLLDGRVIVAETPVEPGTHTVRIEITGKPTFEHTVTLHAGETRFINYTAAGAP